MSRPCGPPTFPSLVQLTPIGPMAKRRRHETLDVRSGKRHHRFRGSEAPASRPCYLADFATEDARSHIWQLLPLSSRIRLGWTCKYFQVEGVRYLTMASRLNWTGPGNPRALKCFRRLRADIQALADTIFDCLSLLDEYPALSTFLWVAWSYGIRPFSHPEAHVHIGHRILTSPKGVGSDFHFQQYTSIRHAAIRLSVSSARVRGSIDRQWHAYRYDLPSIFWQWIKLLYLPRTDLADFTRPDSD